MLTDWPDLAHEFLSRPSAGRVFQYSNASTYTAMRALSSVVGDLADWLSRPSSPARHRRPALGPVPARVRHRRRRAAPAGRGARTPGPADPRRRRLGRTATGLLALDHQPALGLDPSGTRPPPPTRATPWARGADGRRLAPARRPRSARAVPRRAVVTIQAHEPRRGRPRVRARRGDPRLAGWRRSGAQTGDGLRLVCGVGLRGVEPRTFWSVVGAGGFDPCPRTARPAGSRLVPPRHEEVGWIPGVGTTVDVEAHPAGLAASDVELDGSVPWGIRLFHRSLGLPWRRCGTRPSTSRRRGAA